MSLSGLEETDVFSVTQLLQAANQWILDRAEAEEAVEAEEMCT